MPADFVARYHQRITAALHAELKAVPGIEAALDDIRMPYCVASNGSHEKMQVTLGLTGLLPRFKDKLFSVSHVARGKPFPDIYLYAADRSGVPPSACAVIEDTSTGVTAGVAAGMTVFGYCAHTPAQPLARCRRALHLRSHERTSGFAEARQSREVTCSMQS